MKKLFLCLLTAGLFFIYVPKHHAYAQSLYVENYDVKVTLDKDSTFVVSETISYRATGEFHRVWRDITLQDDDAVEKCYQDPTAQCGGFSYITVTDIYDGNGKVVPSSDYTLSHMYENGQDRLRVLWEYAPNGITFNDEIFTWTIKYKVYGGLGYFDTYDLFYWDMFYPDRTYIIKNATADITFPADIQFSQQNLKVLGGTYTYDYDYDDQKNTLHLEGSNLSAYEDFTVLLKYPKGIIDKYATLNLDLKPSTQNLSIDGIEIERVSSRFTGIPAGEHALIFSASGYESQTINLDLAQGEERDLSVHLKMSPETIALYVAVALGNVCACVGGLVVIALVVSSYYRSGRDKGGRKTIVPWFNPPNGDSPVLVGSIKDERVNLTDITSTIINAAIRGYIKIKETEKKKYTLTKIKDFVAGATLVGRNVNYEAIDRVEAFILEKIFDGESEVTTQGLENKFYLKIPSINDEVNKEMVTRGYFEKRPDHVRRDNLIVGVLLLVVGIGLTIGMSFIFVFTCGPTLIIAGVIKMIISFFMPAKTPAGTDAYEKAQGFRMFLHTAERFRLKQQLTPEMFERYLPYAMVFGVEKQWAKNFENIYTKPPSWYEGRDPWSTFNTIYLVNSLSRMNTGVGSVMASAPRSSGSGWSGGGWSGGGGFSGGFGGGGGGGGGGGMS